MGTSIKAILILLLLFVIFLLYWYVIRIWLKIRFYTAQGVPVVKGAYIPVLGNIATMFPLMGKASNGGDRSALQL